MIQSGPIKTETSEAMTQQNTQTAQEDSAQRMRNYEFRQARSATTLATIFIIGCVLASYCVQSPPTEGQNHQPAKIDDHSNNEGIEKIPITKD